jgi:hypothetical protein
MYHTYTERVVLKTEDKSLCLEELIRYFFQGLFFYYYYSFLLYRQIISLFLGELPTVLMSLIKEKITELRVYEAHEE